MLVRTPLPTMLSLRVFLTVSQDLKVNLCGLKQDNIVTVMVRIMMWELPGNSHAVTIQLVVGLYRNVRIIDLNLSVGITNPRRLNLIFIPSVTVKHCILYKFTLIFIYIFYK